MRKTQVKPKKKLGQNFLQSQKIVQHIVQAAKLNKKDNIIEIGPGLGILTIELAKNAKQVTAIELDSSLISILGKNLIANLQGNDLKKIVIVNENALDFTPIEKNYKIVANIPYYITSPLITHFLTATNPPASTTLLVQKEVAEKICTNPPESILALQAQLYAKPSLAFTVSAKHFNPKPKVDSAVIHLETLPAKSRPKNPDQILKLAKRAFSQKRKMLSNTLKDHEEALEKLGLQDKRPQHLSIKDWEKLTKEIKI